MAPTFLPGDEFVANTRGTASLGGLVALEHPEQSDFWLVKRLIAAEGDRVASNGRMRILNPGEAWVLSDNNAVGVRDSTSFGPVDVEGLLPVVETIDDATFVDGVDLLASEDCDLAAIVDRWGLPRFWSRPRGFRTLAILILEQQVSLESAAAVFRRLQDAVGEISAPNLAGRSEEELHQVGLTRKKAGYVVDLARHVDDGSLDLDQLASMTTVEARSQLEEVRGIGRWTADAYLLSAEGRPDIFPVGDRALQVATGEALGLSHIPSPDEIELLSQPWRPIRSVAARLLWHDYLTRRGRVEPIH